MAGFSPHRAKEASGFFDEIKAAIVIAIGCEGDISTLSEEKRATSRGPRQRKPLEEIVRFK